MAEQVVRLADLPGVRAFLDAVAGLLDTVNGEDVPPAVSTAADRVRAEALGIGDEPLEVTISGEKSPVQMANEGNLRTAMRVARENPLRAVHVDWIRE